MKPQFPSRAGCVLDDQAREILTVPASPEPACFFQSGSGFSLGYSPHNDDDRPFHNLGRQFLIESAREQKRELFVLFLMVLASAWAVVSMVVTVVQMICTRHPHF
jgi:hypothetical protein